VAYTPAGVVSRCRSARTKIILSSRRRRKIINNNNTDTAAVATAAGCTFTGTELNLQNVGGRPTVFSARFYLSSVSRPPKSCFNHDVGFSHFSVIDSAAARAAAAAAARGSSS